MGRLAFVWLVAVGAVAAGADAPALERFERTGTEMAVPVRLLFYAPDADTANRAADAAMARIRELNTLLSDYDPQSELRRLCLTAGGGEAVPVSEDLFRVLAAAEGFSRRSEGAFDVTIGPVVRLWRRARRRGELPDPQRLTEARQLVGYSLLHLDDKNRTAKLDKPGMMLDLGGIGKGYAADAAMAVLAKHGIDRALVAVAGEIRLGAPPPGKNGWRVGIAGLADNEPPTQYLSLAQKAISTSGDTRQYVEIGGRRYSHIVDPKTGVGLTDHSIVTVIAPDTMTADALASAVSVLGPKAGLELIDATPGTAALVARQPEGKLETYESRRWKELANPAERDGDNH